MENIIKKEEIFLSIEMMIKNKSKREAVYLHKNDFSFRTAAKCISVTLLCFLEINFEI